MNIKEKLREMLSENKETLKNGETLQISYQGTSPGYLKVAIYKIAKELNLQLSCSVKKGSLSLRRREAEISIIQARPVEKPAASELENDLDLEEIF